MHTAFLHTIVSGAVFTDEFGVLPELDFAETPVGIIYIATRRVGDNIWARMVENVLPNLQQVAPIWETGQQRASVQRPDDEPLDRAARRHQHDADRIAPCQRDRGHRHAGLVGRPRHHAARPACRRHLRGKPAPAAGFRGPGVAAAGRRAWPGTSRHDRPRHHDVPQPDPQAASGRSRRAAIRLACSAMAAGSSRPIATTRSCASRRRRRRSWTRSCCARPGGGWPQGYIDAPPLMAAAE